MHPTCLRRSAAPAQTHVCAPQSTILGMTSRDDLHRLLDAIPEARLPVVQQILQTILYGGLSAPPRRFSSAGTLPAEHDLAELTADAMHGDLRRPE